MTLVIIDKEKRFSLSSLWFLDSKVRGANMGPPGVDKLCYLGLPLQMEPAIIEPSMLVNSVCGEVFYWLFCAIGSCLLHIFGHMDRIDSVAYQLNSVAPEKSDLRFDVAIFKVVATRELPGKISYRFVHGDITETVQIGSGND